MYVFVFASLTTAGRVRFYIKNKTGISFDINKVPSSRNIPGCSYGIFVNEANKETVMDIIKELDVNFIGVFDEKTINGGGADGIS